MLTEREYLMWYSALAKLSHTKKELLLKRFGSAENIFKAAPSVIRGIKGLSEVNINDICENRDEEALRRYAERVYENDISYIVKDEKYYPDFLRETFKPPFGIYVKGDKEVLLKNKVSIVGTRKATPYGISTAKKLAADFAGMGIVVVSGMADGIDSAAHRGALEGGGETIAVFGCGVNVCYPKTNKTLMERIVGNGCVISEYAVDEKPNARYFPSRNRIIAALSMAAVVVEAEEKGGSLITAGLAVDLGRDLYCVPGNINSRASIGTNNLLKKCAYVMTEAKDIFRTLGYEETAKENEKKTAEKTAPSGQDLGENDKKVLECISEGEITLDEIIYKTGLNVAEVKLILLTLELQGDITRLPGSKYITL